MGMRYGGTFVLVPAANILASPRSALSRCFFQFPARMETFRLWRMRHRALGPYHEGRCLLYVHIPRNDTFETRPGLLRSNTLVENALHS